MRVLRHDILLVLTFAIMMGLSAWLQFGVLDSPVAEPSDAEKGAPDYYVRNFVFTGRDGLGKRYELRADRMVHYPIGDRALLENPRIIQYSPNGAPRHVHADTGWLDNETSEVLLTGNVRVLQDQAGASGSAFTGERMVIILDEDRG